MIQVSNAFAQFSETAPEHYQAWMEVVGRLGAASCLDTKTKELAYLAVMAALRLETGIPFHVKTAKANGCSREEIVSAILIGLPAAGNVVIGALPAALQAFEEE